MRKARPALINDTCECGNHDHGCEACTCRDCGNWLEKGEETGGPCNDCIDKKDAELAKEAEEQTQQEG